MTLLVLNVGWTRWTFIESLSVPCTFRPYCGNISTYYGGNITCAQISITDRILDEMTTYAIYYVSKYSERFHTLLWLWVLDVNWP